MRFKDASSKGFAQICNFKSFQRALHNWKLLLFLAMIGSICACESTHYSVAVARGPDHVTFAQRHDSFDEDDYLVDCALDAGRPDNCRIIDLEAE